MNQTISILIVEDEVLIAQDLKEILEEMGYNEVFKARNYEQALNILTENSIDLALLDINLNDTHSGTDLAKHINQNHPIPFIYLTSYSDAATLLSVKQSRPSGFLLKPYSKDLLMASIEIALFNYESKINAADKRPDETAPDTPEKSDLIFANHILVKENYRYLKIPFGDILWFETDKNYVEIKTFNKRYVVRISLKKLLELLPAQIFVRCHKQFVVNAQHVEAFGMTELLINQTKIPISRNMQEQVLLMLKK